MIFVAAADPVPATIRAQVLACTLAHDQRAQSATALHAAAVAAALRPLSSTTMMSSCGRP
jgi:hypothetical protein